MRKEILKDNSPYNEAYTLVELLCVLAILGLVLSFVTPRIWASQSTYLEQMALRQVMGDMRFIQDQAIRTGKLSYIKINRPLGKKYILYYKDVDGNSIQKVKSLPGPIRIRSDYSNPVFIRYKSDGFADIFQTVEFHRGGASSWKLIPYQTGQIRVVKGV